MTTPELRAALQSCRHAVSEAGHALSVAVQRLDALEWLMVAEEKPLPLRLTEAPR